MRGSKLTDRQRAEKRKKDLINNVIMYTLVALYVGLLLGAVAYKNPDSNLLDIITLALDNPLIIPFPSKISYVIGSLVVAACIDVVLWEQYEAKKNIVSNPNGDASFEEDYLGYDKEFVIDPKIVEKTTGKKPRTVYTEEHKKVVLKPRITNKQNRQHQYKDKVYAACWANTQIYADKVALSLNGSWCQRNSNAVIFGASGAGKSRFFLNPNLLQYNSNYIVTDPSGEIMAGYGAGLRAHGYIVKCLNISEMTKSCRFNPLYYIKNTSDIPVIVTTLMENTQKNKNAGGDDFWAKTTQALLCCIIGYLYEVEPLERRNFYNVLEILRMAQVDENDTETDETEFDKMFEKLGQKNPNSYAFHQYETYHLAPRKTALNILISTAVLISTYIDIAEFNNLTYKDEMDLDKFGAAPFKLKEGATLFPEDVERYKERYAPDIVANPNALPAIPEGYIDVEDFQKYADADLLERDKLGRYKEGEPYRVAVFLCIPTADTTYNWLTAMLYSITFKLVYRRGETRAKQQVQNSPELALHARFLIDECANIGKIPNLQEYLATCRKYKISIVPIFQSFSQITEVYGKEDANSIIANCDTTLFLGGVDSDTIKIVLDRLGKETVKSMNQGKSNNGKSKSRSENIQTVGRELMSRTQIEQMSNAECIILIRALKPFRVKKFALQDHPNYKYTAEANPEEYSFVNPFQNEYRDEAIEAIRIKKEGEDGYVEPKEVDSARLRALKAENRMKRQQTAHDLYDKADEFGPVPGEGANDKARSAHVAYVHAIDGLMKEAVADDDTTTINLLKKIIDDYHLPLSAVEKSKSVGQAGAETKSAEQHEADLKKARTEIIIDSTGENLKDLNPDDVNLCDAYSRFSEFATSDISEEARAEKTNALLNMFFGDGAVPVAGAGETPEQVEPEQEKQPEAPVTEHAAEPDIPLVGEDQPDAEEPVEPEAPVATEPVTEQPDFDDYGDIGMFDDDGEYNDCESGYDDGIEDEFEAQMAAQFQQGVGDPDFDEAVLGELSKSLGESDDGDIDMYDEEDDYV